MLAPVLDPLDRPAEQARGQHDHQLLVVQEVLAAEPAADIGRDDANAALVGAQHLYQPGADLVRHLGRRPDRGPVLDRVVACDRSSALDRMRGTAMLDERFVRDMRRAHERSVAIAVGLAEFEQHVALLPAADDGRVRARRLAASRHRRQRFVLDLDQRGRILRDISAVRDYRRDRLADMAHLVGSQDEGRNVFRQLVRLEPERHSRLGNMGTEVVALIDRADTLHTGGGGGIDPSDPGVRVGAADEGRVQHAGHADVVDELPAPAQQRRILDPADPLSYGSQGFRRFSDGRRGAGTALHRHIPWSRVGRAPA